MNSKSRTNKERAASLREPPSPTAEKASTAIDDLLKSVKTVTDYRCVNHPDRSATAVCESCGADLCARCYSIRAHSIICPQCVSALGKVLGEGPSRHVKRIFTHPLVVAIILAFLFANILFACGRSQRRGLLGVVPENAIEAEEHLRLANLLFAQKAERLEAHADLLLEHGRPEEANRKYERSLSVYESLQNENKGRWEEKLTTLSRARILAKMGERNAAVSLYEELAGEPGEDKTFPVLAEFHLAELLENTDPQGAVENYKKILDDLKFVPDTFTKALNIMAHSEGAYNYETRVWSYTRNDINFGDIKDESLLRMGRLLISLNRLSEAEYRLWLLVDGSFGTKRAEEAMVELNRIGSRKRPAQQEAEPQQPKEVVITHFD